jgi:hypothetical protein
MKVSHEVTAELQSKANHALARQFDGSDDWWTYVMVGEDEWAINIWDADMWGDGTNTGLRITAYICNEDGVDTSDWITLDVNVIYLFVQQARLRMRLKLKEVI